jgi:hypothetical protein
MNGFPRQENPPSQSEIRGAQALNDEDAGRFLGDHQILDGFIAEFPGSNRAEAPRKEVVSF